MDMLIVLLVFLLYCLLIGLLFGLGACGAIYNTKDGIAAASVKQRCCGGETSSLVSFGSCVVGFHFVVLQCFNLRHPGNLLFLALPLLIGTEPASLTPFASFPW